MTQSQEQSFVYFSSKAGTKLLSHDEQFLRDSNNGMAFFILSFIVEGSTEKLSQF